MPGESEVRLEGDAETWEIHTRVMTVLRSAGIPGDKGDPAELVLRIVERCADLALQDLSDGEVETVRAFRGQVERARCALGTFFLARCHRGTLDDRARNAALLGAALLVPACGSQSLQTTLEEIALHWKFRNGLRPLALSLARQELRENGEVLQRAYVVLDGLKGFNRSTGSRPRTGRRVTTLKRRTRASLETLDTPPKRNAGLPAPAPSDGKPKDNGRTRVSPPANLWPRVYVLRQARCLARKKRGDPKLDFSTKPEQWKDILKLADGAAKPSKSGESGSRKLDPNNGRNKRRLEALRRTFKAAGAPWDSLISPSKRGLVRLRARVEIID